MTQKPKLAIIGHRGARGLYPENTLTGFLEAVKIGVRGLEMDVVISKDKQVVVSHEPWMNDLFCTQPGGNPIEKDSAKKYNLYEMDYATIQKFDCGKIGHPKFPQQKKTAEFKPLLSDVISAVEEFCKENNFAPVAFNIEIKSEPGHDGIFQPVPSEFVSLVFKVLKNYSLGERVYISSFDPRILQEIKKTHPEMTLGLLVENYDSLQVNLDTLGFSPDIYSPYFQIIDQQLVNELHAKNINLVTWTVNEPHNMKRLIDMGVDGIITDYPDRLVYVSGTF